MKIFQSEIIPILVSAEQKDNKYVSFSGLHTTTSPYEKVCSANAAFSLA